MIYFKKELTYKANKSSVEKAISSLILDENKDYFSFFPFCLFDKEYYLFLKQKRQAPYSGKLIGDKFQLFRYIGYGGVPSRTIRTIKIIGEITSVESQMTTINVKFVETYFYAIFLCTIPIILIVSWLFDFHFKLILMMTLIFIVNEVYLIVSNLIKIDKRIKNNVA
jgi:hypothetical protein